MTNITLRANLRQELGKKVKRLRNQGLIPAVLYGPNVKNLNLSVNYADFLKVYRQAGETTLVNLVIDDQKPISVLIHDVAFNPLTDKIDHVDFYQVSMTKKIKTKIPLRFVGEAPAVKELGGVLVHGFNEVEVECLPGQLVPYLEVDISPLKTFEDALHLHDLKLPEGLELVLKTDEILAKVIPPRSEEEITKVSEKTEEEIIGEVKVLTEEKKKEKEAAKAEEGEASE